MITMESARQVMKSWIFFFSSRRRHTRFDCDWSSDVCSSDLARRLAAGFDLHEHSVECTPPGGAGRELEFPERLARELLDTLDVFRRWNLRGQIGRASCRERV